MRCTWCAAPGWWRRSVPIVGRAGISVDPPPLGQPVPQHRPERRPVPAPEFRRPAMLSDERAALLSGEPDPADRNDLAHTTATALVAGGRAGADDADLQRRLVQLVDVEGLDRSEERRVGKECRSRWWP